VFYAKVNVGRTSQPNGGTFVTRARSFGATTGQSAATAMQGVSSAAQTAYAGVSKGVQQGVYNVRVWAAPRLESAADYHATTVAPKVTSALLVSAQQVRPVDVTKKKGPSVLTWSLLAAAVMAAAGAVSALVVYRNRAAMTAETDDEDFTVDAAGQTTQTTVVAPGAGTVPVGTTTAGTTTAGGASTMSTADSGRATTSTDAGVNGRVSASDW
jgi:hypothetical protein